MATRTWTGTTSGDWAVSTNWQEGSVPVAGDDVFLQNSSVDITTNLNQSAVTLASLWVDQTYTGNIGTSTTYLQVGATTLTIGRQAPGNSTASGSGRVNINLVGVASTVVVLGSATSATDTAFTPIRLLGANITSCNITNGTVGLAVAPGETATITTLAVGNGGNASNPVVYVGRGVSAATVDLAAGTIYSDSTNTITTLNVSGTATYTHAGSAAVTTMNLDAGTVNYTGTGTITTANVTGTLDFSGDPRAKTVTTANLYKTGTLNANTGAPLSVTFTNGVQLQHCGLPDVTLLFGPGRKITAS